MPKLWLFGIGFDRPLDPTLPPIPFAESSLALLSQALEPFKTSSLTLLGHAATGVVIQSRLRQLKQSIRAGDELILHYCGFGYTHEDRPFLFSWDSLSEDRDDTSLDLLATLKPLARKLKSLTLLLDLQPLDGALPLDPRALCTEFPNLNVLCHSTPGEESYAAANLKARLGTYLTAEALAGRLPKALNEERQLTLAGLHAAMEEALPRLLRRHLESGLSQRPEYHGEADALLADLTPLLGERSTELLNPDRLARVAFRSESWTKVKDLSDFRKSYQIPDSASPSSKKFIARLAQSDIKADLEDMLQVLREPLALRRKEADVLLGTDGTGTLRTPYLEYTVQAMLEADDPTRVHWRRELGQFRDATFLQSAEFQQLFAARFDQLVFEFRQPIDLDDLVDQLEEQPPKGVKLQLGSDDDACDITLAGFSGRIRLMRQSLIIEGRGGLLDQLLAFLKQFGTLGEPLALPGKQ